jgi:hypothetical protein
MKSLGNAAKNLNLKFNLEKKYVYSRDQGL